MKLIKTVMFALLATLGAAASASVLITKDTSVTDTVPGIAEYVTNGTHMTGMRVRATFADGFSEVLSWAATGDESGGVSGNGWGLTVDGNTFSADWLFTIGANRGQLLSFSLDAAGPNQFTLFDTDFGGEFGTESSALGSDFDLLDCSSCDAEAIYSNVVAEGAAPAVGDVFHTLLVNFNGGTGPRSDFSFRQDTDTDSGLVIGEVPEPASVALLALAMVGMGAALRRRK